MVVLIRRLKLLSNLSTGIAVISQMPALCELQPVSLAAESLVGKGSISAETDNISGLQIGENYNYVLVFAE